MNRRLYKKHLKFLSQKILLLKISGCDDSHWCDKKKQDLDCVNCIYYMDPENVDKLCDSIAGGFVNNLVKRIKNSENG